MQSMGYCVGTVVYNKSALVTRIYIYIGIVIYISQKNGTYRKKRELRPVNVFTVIVFRGLSSRILSIEHKNNSYTTYKEVRQKTL